MKVPQTSSFLNVGHLRLAPKVSTNTTQMSTNYGWQLGSYVHYFCVKARIEIMQVQSVWKMYFTNNLQRYIFKSKQHTSIKLLWTVSQCKSQIMSANNMFDLLFNHIRRQKCLSMISVYICSAWPHSKERWKADHHRGRKHALSLSYHYHWKAFITNWQSDKHNWWRILAHLDSLISSNFTQPLKVVCISHTVCQCFTLNDRNKQQK